MIPFPVARLFGPTRHPLRDNLPLILLALVLVPAVTIPHDVHLVLTVLAILGGLLIPIWGIASIRRRKHSFCGPADRITLLRMVLTGGVAALALISLPGGHPVGAQATLLHAVSATALDGVDGYVARRTGTASRDGARFDVDADALLALALSVSASVIVGWWVMLIALMRYAYVGAARVRPALRQPLAPSLLRRGIGVAQPIALCAVIAPGLPGATATAIAVIALALLTFSFGRDIWNQERAGRAAGS